MRFASILSIACAVAFIAGRSMRPPVAVEAAQWSLDHHPALDQLVETFDVEDTDLQYAVDQLVRQNKAPIQVDWASLTRSKNIDPAKTVTAHFKHVPLSVALHELFRLASVDEQPRMVYHQAEGLIELTSPDDQTVLVVRLYDVSDLLPRISKGADDPERRQQFTSWIEGQCNIGPSAMNTNYPQVTLFGDQLVVSAAPKEQDKVYAFLQAARNSR